jgi:hypothetical protein
VIGINQSNPMHEIHIVLEDGTEYTDEDIWIWANSMPISEKDEIIRHLSQIIIMLIKSNGNTLTISTGKNIGLT